MFLLLQKLLLLARWPRIEQLHERAKQMDEVLIGCNLAPDTRQRLQVQRDEVENQLRELRAV